MDFLTQLSHSTTQATPLLLLLATGLILMLLDVFKVKAALPWVTATGLIISSVLAYTMGSPESDVIFSGMIESGGIAPTVHILLCLSGLLTLFFLTDYLNRQEKPIYDIYALLIFAIIGMILMANANDLIITFIGLETMSICLYIFAAVFKKDARSNESGLKYFLLGSFASAFLLFGISLIYGIGASTNLNELSVNGALFQSNELIFYTAVGLILIGFLFKISAFPFHNWTPDVYEGTPTPLAGFMATGSKMAAFIALGVIIQKLDLIQYDKIVTILAVSSLFTMVYGNIVAAQQNNVKRMLAYSSIAHSGYVMLGLLAGAIGFTAVIFYMFIYTLMNLGAFGMVGMAEREYEDTSMENWRGLGLKAPYFAGILSIFLFSLAGIPPLAGFMAKYQIFITAIRENMVFLAVVGILASVIGAYYYIRLIVIMFFGKDEQPNLNIIYNGVPIAGTVILVLLILLLGVFPNLVLDPIDTVTRMAGSIPKNLSVVP
ncbi:MAG: NADH-quinone oxidoreductase subunit N [Bacteroidota bacterium]